MDWRPWAQLALFIAMLAALTPPLGRYLTQVLAADGRTFLDPLVSPLERRLYRWLRLDQHQDQPWRQYAASLLAFTLVSTLFTYALLRLQQRLPLNPMGLGPISDHGAFNMAVSFATNTNWQSCSSETVLSYGSQMVGLALHNFVSAAAGIAVAAALARGLARQGTGTVGSFWVDLVRTTLYLLLPLSLVYALFLVAQGVPQNFAAYVQATPVDSLPGQAANGQVLAQGPMASQVAIKMLGTNGGGFTNANAAHPYENPTPLTNFVQTLSMLCIPSGLTYYLGQRVRHQRHGWSLWGAMLILFVVGLLVCWQAESGGNPRLTALGVDCSRGNMEGKEVRFGAFGSALFATVTTDASCGAVNAMHDSFTPVGGLAALFNIQTGEVIFGGVGSGLYGMVVFVVLAVFVAGLMVGRTPDYLGKKIEAREVKLAALVVLVTPLGVLAPTAWALSTTWGRSSLANAGPHGLTEVLYAFSSAVGNNGSSFAGLNAGTPEYDTLLGLAMLAGRFLVIVPVLALAGSLSRKKAVAATAGSLPVAGPTFVLLLLFTILIVGSLTFVPALTLGPIAEHYVMQGSLHTF